MPWIERYHQDGLVKLTEAIAPEYAQNAEQWIRLNRDRSDMQRTLDAFDSHEQRPIKLRALWECDSGFWSKFLSSSGILPIVGRVLGDEFLLIRSAAFIKYPNSRSKVGWHRDEDLWGIQCEAGLTAWVPLTKAPLEAGGLEFLRGSHQMKPGRLVFDFCHPYHKVMDVTGMGPPIAAPAGVGDLILMDKSTVHSSGQNRTRHERIGLVLAFARTKSEALSEVSIPVRLVGQQWQVAEPRPRGSLE